MAIIGLVILGIAFINISKNSKGAVRGEQADQPAVNANNNAAANNNNNNQPNGPIDLKVTKDDHILGNFDAPITLLEWSDFQCPYCARFHEAVKQIMSEYSGRVRWVFRNFPLDSIHPNARIASEAAECANDQGKFWEFSDAVFVDQPGLGAGGATFLKQTAEKVGLEASKFTSCLNDGKYKNKVEQQEQAGIAAGVQGTPGSFLNGVALGGALPYESLKAQIDALLK